MGTRTVTDSPDQDWVRFAASMVHVVVSIGLSPA
jgi:hypothetical protein